MPVPTFGWVVSELSVTLLRLSSRFDPPAAR